MEHVIEVKGLVKRYKELTAVDHLDLQVKKGRILGLLGPNGSGKSTTINCILSLLKYDQGEVVILGEKMSPDANHLKPEIGVVFQDVGVFDELTVYENINYFCGLYIRDKQTRKEKVEKAIQLVGLNDFRTFRPKQLSGGLLRRLNIACGIAHQPKLIILDEPTVAVDPQSRSNILEGIQRLNKAGATILYTSHYMEEVEQICTRIAIMDKGRIIATGTKEQLKAMISSGEKIRVELFDMDDNILQDLKKLPHIVSVEYEDNFLIVKSSRGKNNLLAVLDYLKSNNIAFGKIYSEPPTLNDVFLEITGKELRD